MARLKFKTNQKITIGVLIVFAGVCILSSTYFNEKKFQVFDDMNELYYEQLVELEVELEELEPTENNVDINDDGNDSVVEEDDSNETTPNVVVPEIDYTKYYVGYLSIPKISFKKGFTDIDNKYNTVNRNIEVMKTSDYPDINKGNFIIAGHSGSTSVSFFKDLYKLSLEDEVYLTYKNNEYKYIIKNIYTVPKTGSVSIKRNKEKTVLTLITCTKGDKTTQTVYIAEKE